MQDSQFNPNGVKTTASWPAFTWAGAGQIASVLHTQLDTFRVNLFLTHLPLKIPLYICLSVSIHSSPLGSLLIFLEGDSFSILSLVLPETMTLLSYQLSKCEISSLLHFTSTWGWSEWCVKEPCSYCVVFLPTHCQDCYLMSCLSLQHVKGCQKYPMLPTQLRLHSVSESQTQRARIEGGNCEAMKWKNVNSVW